MGYPAVNGVVSTDAALAPISVNQATTMPGVASTSFSMSTNLDSSTAAGTSFSTPITVYDSLGTAQTLSVNYTNVSPNSWSYSVTLPASATGGTGSPTTIASGSLTFNSSGQLTAPTGTVTGINITGLADGAAPMNLTWNLNVLRELLPPSRSRTPPASPPQPNRTAMAWIADRLLRASGRDRAGPVQQ